MATFIDDQGGTGWTPGSHAHFRLTAAWLPTANVRFFQEAVRKLRRTLGLRTDYEFKFSKTHSRRSWRTDFYNLALLFGLHFTTCSFNKKRIREGSVEPSVFHQVGAVSLAAHLRPIYEQTEAARCTAAGQIVLLREPLVVDDNKNSRMLAAIEHAFRTLRSTCEPYAMLTNKPEFRDSKMDAAVQLADMVMGAVGAHLDGDSLWYNLIRRGNLGVVDLSSCQSRPGSNDLSETWWAGPFDDCPAHRESSGTQGTA